MRKKGVLIGTSGYNYKHWAGLFYPQGLPQKRWFEYYRDHFDTLEINLSFYRLPKAEDYANWKRNSPRDFLFFVKGSRFITHMKKLKDCGQALDRFYERALHLEEKLAGVLWQMPPFLKKDAEKLEVFFKELSRFPKMRHCFEFRHESWFDGEIAGILARHGAAHCRADRLELYSRIEIPDTADFVYIRRHGEKTFADTYTDAQILRDAAEAVKWRNKGKLVFVYYNNDLRGSAISDAVRLRTALASRASEGRAKAA